MSGLITSIQEARKFYRGLTDHAVSHFLRESNFKIETGFEFAAVENSKIIFAVPTRDLDAWKAPSDIYSARIECAKEIGDKHSLDQYLIADSETGLCSIGFKVLPHKGAIAALAYPKYLEINPSASGEIDFDELFRDLTRLYGRFFDIAHA